MPMAYTPTDELAHFEGARADARSTYQNLLGERDEKRYIVKGIGGRRSLRRAKSLRIMP